MQTSLFITMTCTYFDLGPKKYFALVLKNLWLKEEREAWYANSACFLLKKPKKYE